MHLHQDGQKKRSIRYNLMSHKRGSSTKNVDTLGGGRGSLPWLPWGVGGCDPLQVFPLNNPVKTGKFKLKNLKSYSELSVSFLDPSMNYRNR